MLVFALACAYAWGQRTIYQLDGWFADRSFCTALSHFMHPSDFHAGAKYSVRSRKFYISLVASCFFSEKLKAACGKFFVPGCSALISSVSFLTFSFLLAAYDSSSVYILEQPQAPLHQKKSVSSESESFLSPCPLIFLGLRALIAFNDDYKTFVLLEICGDTVFILLSKSCGRQNARTHINFYAPKDRPFESATNDK